MWSNSWNILRDCLNNRSKGNSYNRTIQLVPCKIFLSIRWSTMRVKSMVCIHISLVVILFLWLAVPCFVSNCLGSLWLNLAWFKVLVIICLASTSAGRTYDFDLIRWIDGMLATSQGLHGLHTVNRRYIRPCWRADRNTLGILVDKALLCRRSTICCYWRGCLHTFRIMFMDVPCNKPEMNYSGIVLFNWLWNSL